MSRHIRLVEMTKAQEDAILKLVSSCEVIKNSGAKYSARKWMMQEVPAVLEWLFHHRSTTFKDAPSPWNWLPSEVATKTHRRIVR